MKSRIIDFYYFSGTGNTLLVVKKMKEVFEENGSKVNLYRMEKARPEDIDLNHTIGMGFPVAAQGTYPFVWDFIKSLPQANGTPIFMVDTLAMYSGGIVGPVKKIVKNKGYNPIGAKEIRMPNNFFPRKIIFKKNEKKVCRGLEAAKRYAEDILNDKSKWGRIPVLSDMMAMISQSEWSWNLCRKWYSLKIDTSKCNKCGLCVELCPVNNIMMNENPEFGIKCNICMRCISFCQTEAIYLPKKKYKLYRAVKVDELLKDG